MPCLKIITNVPKGKVPADFVDKIIPVLSACVGKPAEKFFCTIIAETPVSFGGDSVKPCVIASLESIGNLGPKENARISKDISGFIEKQIGVSPGRCFISFYDELPQNIGIAGTTVAELDKSRV